MLDNLCDVGIVASEGLLEVGRFGAPNFNEVIVTAGEDEPGRVVKDSAKDREVMTNDSLELSKALREKSKCGLVEWHGNIEKSLLIHKGEDIARSGTQACFDTVEARGARPLLGTCGVASFAKQGLRTFRKTSAEEVAKVVLWDVTKVACSLLIVKKMIIASVIDSRGQQFVVEKSGLQ